MSEDPTEGVIRRFNELTERLAIAEHQRDALKAALELAVRQHDELVMQMRPEFPNVPMELWEKPESWIHSARQALKELEEK